jgi:hypothetical protein
MVLIRLPLTGLLTALLIAVVATAVSAQSPVNRDLRRPPQPLGPSSGPRPLLYGFAIDCTRCRLGPGDVDPAPVWHYSELPRIAAVKPGGSAAAAGVLAGDTVVLVDGLSILSSEGARRFSSARPGDRVRLTLHRAGSPVDALVTLRRPGDVSPLAAPSAQSPRYSGEVGGAAVDVWSSVPVTASVDSTGALVIRTGSSTIRVAPTRP